MKRVFDMCRKCAWFDSVAIPSLSVNLKTIEAVGMCCRKSLDFPVFCPANAVEEEGRRKFESMDVPEDCELYAEYFVEDCNG